MTQNNLASGFRSKIKEVISQKSIQPYLYSLAVCFIFALLALAFAFIRTPVGSDEKTQMIYLVAAIACFIGLLFLSLPLLFGLTISVSTACRFQAYKKKPLSVLFSNYFHSNFGAYGISLVLWRTILAAIVSSIFFALIVVPIITYGYPSIYNAMAAFLKQAGATTQSLESMIDSNDLFAFHTIFLLMESGVVFTTALYMLSELRKNECVTYSASVLVADNRINMAARPLIPFFRKRVLPRVSKEYRHLDFQLFWPVYLAYFLVYWAIVILGVFFFGKYYNFVPFVALALAGFLFTPFAYWFRIFDNLFYIAYQDKIMARLGSDDRAFIMEGRKAMEEVLRPLEEEENKGETSSTDEKGKDNLEEKEKTSQPSEGKDDKEEKK
ncbi:MAG: hypothetical protein LKJ88_06150 [Bacilli bacterium]|jgi:hypothetical protein|nr:hypothetical protein [Bacilli bacterium]